MAGPPHAAPKTHRVLVASGADAWLDAVRRALSGEAVATSEARSGRDALARAREEEGRAFALVLLDAFLPDLTGLGLCRLLREDEVTAEVPIIVVSRFSDEIDRILAFEHGADDFLEFPFYGRELASRVRAVLRRNGRTLRRTPGPERHFGPLRVDLQRALVEVDGERVRLTAREFELLRVLVENEGKVLQRRTLLEQTGEPEDATTLRVVDTHVKGIRRKLGAARGCIETIRGVGYRFQPDRADMRSDRERERDAASDRAPF
jgi:DNA-binding response OmpR family regulator